MRLWRERQHRYGNDADDAARRDELDVATEIAVGKRPRTAARMTDAAPDISIGKRALTQRVKPPTQARWFELAVEVAYEQLVVLAAALGRRDPVTATAADLAARVALAQARLAAPHAPDGEVRLAELERLLAELDPAAPASAVPAGAGSAALAPASAAPAGVGSAAPDETLAVARDATSGGGSALPHLERIQASFGRHDISGVRVHDDDAAGRGAAALGARAFAFGDAIAARGSLDLHTAAHEAAHVVQQRAGLAPEGGVSRPGDPLERHADAVADAVVAGRSAERMLDQVAGRATLAGRTNPRAYAIQRRDETGSILGEELVLELDFGSERIGIFLRLTPEQKQAFAADPRRGTQLALDVAYAFTRGGRPRFESSAFLGGTAMRDVIERDLPAWLRGKGLAETHAFLDRRQATFDGLRLLAPLERHLAAQGIGAGTIDWNVVLPGLLAVEMPGPKSYAEASRQDRYVTFLNALRNEVANRPSVTGATATAAQLSPLVAAYANALPDTELGNLVTTHSEAFVHQWAPRIARISYVPSGFDLERLRPRESQATLESHRQRVIAEFKRTKMPNLIVQYVRDHWSHSQQSPDNYLKHLDMKSLRKFVVAHMADAFVALGKTDAAYRRALASAAHDQSRFDILQRMLLQARALERNHAQLEQRLLRNAPGSDASDDAIAANPAAYAESAEGLASLTNTVFSTIARGGDLGQALKSVPNTPANRLFGAVTALMGLGTAIQNLRDEQARQEKETRRDLERDLDLKYDEVAKIVQTMWDDADKWIRDIYIPKLKEVALRILKKNRDELAAWEKNFDTETPKVVAGYKIAAFALRDIQRKLKSGEITSAQVQGHIFTVKDDKLLEDAAKTVEGLAKRLGSEDGKKEKRDELREALEAFDRTKEKIEDGDYPPHSWGENVATVARRELGVGEFPPYTTYRQIFTGAVQASENPFIARAIQNWQFWEIQADTFRAFAKAVALGLLTVASILVPGVGGLILTAIDIGVNIWQSKEGYDKAKAALDLALLDPHLELQGLTVDQARAALKSAKIAFALSILIPAGIAAFFAMVVWRLGKAGKNATGFKHLDAAFKKDPVRVQQLLDTVQDLPKLDKLIGAVNQDLKLLDALLLHAGTVAGLERLLLKITDARKLLTLLDRARGATRVFKLLDHVVDFAQLERLLAHYGPDLAALEAHLVKLGKLDKATAGAQLESLITKAGGLGKLRPLLDAGGDLSRLGPLLDKMKAERLSALLAKVGGSVDKLEALIKLVTDLDKLEALLAKVGKADKLLELLEKAGSVKTLEHVLARTRSAGHAGELLKAYGKNVAQLEKHLAALGADAAAGAKLSSMLGKTKGVAGLEKLLGMKKVGGNLADLEKVLSHAKATDMGALEKLLDHPKVADLAHLGRLMDKPRVTNLGQLEKLLGHAKLKDPADLLALEKLLEHAKVPDIAKLEQLLGSAKINKAETLEKLFGLVDNAAQLERLLASTKVNHGVPLAKAIEMCDTAARFERLLGMSDDLAKLTTHLNKAGKKAGAAKLEEILIFVGPGNAAKIDRMAHVAAGNAAEFTKMVDWAHKLPRQPPTAPPVVAGTAHAPAAAARHNFPGGANMPHFFEHTWEFVDISKRHGKQTTFFPPKTDAAKMRGWMDEALDALNAGNPSPRLPTPGNGRDVPISVGTVRIGSEMHGGQLWIGQFYPKFGETIEWIQLDAIGKVLQ